MEPIEHIGTFFPPFGAESLLAGVGPADVYNRDPLKWPLLTTGATIYGDGVLASKDNVVFCQTPPFVISKVMGALSALDLTNDPATDHQKCALVSLGGLPTAQFGQKVPAGQVGKTYTFAAYVKPIEEQVIMRLKVERAGPPYAVSGPYSPVKAHKWTELHVTFVAQQEHPDGWEACIDISSESAKFEVNRARLYEGPYVPIEDPASAATTAPERNFFKNVNFESGLTSWYFTHGPEQFNQRRTFERTSFAVSRLLGNLGVSGSTPLLERFADPVGTSNGPSAGRWLDGLYITRPTEWDDPYRFFGW
jgi:hypothetical protein